MKKKNKVLRIIVLSVLLLLLTWWPLTDFYIIDTGFESDISIPIFNCPPRLTDKLVFQSERSKYDISDDIDIKLYLGIHYLSPEFDGIIRLNMESEGFISEPEFPLTFDLSTDEYSYLDFNMETEPSSNAEIENIPYQLEFHLKVDSASCPESGVILFNVDIGDFESRFGNGLYFYRTENRIYFSTESIEDAKLRGCIVP